MNNTNNVHSYNNYNVINAFKSAFLLEVLLFKFVITIYIFVRND